MREAVALLCKSPPARRTSEDAIFFFRFLSFLFFVFFAFVFIEDGEQEEEQKQQRRKLRKYKANMPSPFTRRKKETEKKGPPTPRHRAALTMSRRDECQTKGEGEGVRCS